MQNRRLLPQLGGSTPFGATNARSAAQYVFHVSRYRKECHHLVSVISGKMTEIWRDQRSPNVSQQIQCSAWQEPT